MPLLNDVKAILARLSPRGWKDLFQTHGLDISVPLGGLATELAKPLTIDRTQPGFEEFAFDGIRAVEPGVPGRSLLYHALASPDVRPNTPTPGPADFPTLEELDTVENYIYSTAKRILGSFSNPVLAVFAYQYRDKGLSPHRNHADLCFSRTGVARVGTEAIRYDPTSRSYDPRPSQGDRGFAALPARYGLFIAEYRTPTAADQVLRAVPPDATQIFLFPVHKVFAGNECLWSDTTTPMTIPSLQFIEQHISEKLRRIHTPGADNPGRVPPLAIFNIDLPPFVRVTPGATDLVGLQSVGASVLTVPVPNTIARTAVQKVGAVDQMARFKVPAAVPGNRFWTSLQLSATANGRAAPEYANMRQEVRPTPGGGFQLVDLNLVPNGGTPPAQRFDAKMTSGNYEAAHFVDGTCDGVVACQKPAPLAQFEMFPAYSLVSAVDYFPQVEQVEITEWIESLGGSPIGLGNPGLHFDQGGPEPLSDGRFRATISGSIIRTNRIPNQGLNDLLAPAKRAFPPSEAASRSVSAIVGRAATAGSGTRPGEAPFATTWLPDAAADVFLPGWDTSQHRTGGSDTYVTYGLGSPFPEDAKLCAALNSFWPAAAPDSSRTYGFFAGSSGLLPTGIPLTDGELGYHPGHPRVAAGETVTNLGWDGDHGPFFTQHDGKTWVNASSPNRADETRAAFDGKLGFSGLDALTTHETIGRMNALRFCRAEVLPLAVLDDVWLVTVEVVREWGVWVSAVNPKLDATLSGPGLIYVFVRAGTTPTPTGDPPLRQEFEVLNRIAIHLDATQAFWKKDNQPTQRVAR